MFFLNRAFFRCSMQDIFKFCQFHVDRRGGNTFNKLVNNILQVVAMEGRGGEVFTLNNPVTPPVPPLTIYLKSTFKEFPSYPPPPFPLNKVNKSLKKKNSLLNKLLKEITTFMYIFFHCLLICLFVCNQCTLKRPNRSA